MDPENPQHKEHLNCIQLRPFGYVFKKFKLWCDTVEGVYKCDIPKKQTFKEELNKNRGLEYARVRQGGDVIKYKMKFWDHTVDDEELPCI